MRHALISPARGTLAATCLAAVAIAGSSGPSAQAAPAAPFRAHRAYVDVSVATVWIDPSKPRAVDRPALTDPVHPRAWARAMTPAQEGQLSEDNMTQTQALYGAEVRVIAHAGHWSQVEVLGQPTPRDPVGYPGWIPDAQLSTAPAYARAVAADPFALVRKAPTARLFHDARLTRPGLEISANTRLPVTGRTARAYRVSTPDGAAWLRRGAAGVHRSDSAMPRPTGADLVATARAFLGGKYLWAGRSGFALDCSGFTGTVYQLHGITIPRDSGPQSQDPRAHRVSKARLRTGDLLFYSRTSDPATIYHVAMYAGHDRMLEAYDHTTPVRITQVRRGASFWGAVRYLP